MGAERLVSGKPSMLGGASGAVAGLVAVTPAAGASGPIGAMLLGAAASLVCYGFVGSFKNRLRLDDSLDVFGIHGLGGIIGSIGTAIVALAGARRPRRRRLRARPPAGRADCGRRGRDRLVGRGLGFLLWRWSGW